eukprot:654539-Pelagomonas_calceolata.AAC.3
MQQSRVHLFTATPRKDDMQLGNLILANIALHRNQKGSTSKPRKLDCNIKIALVLRMLVA